MNVNRLIQKKACWREPNPSIGLKKKNLLLADWTAVNWSEEHLNEVIALLDRLLADDFKIYIWQDGQTIPLKSSRELKRPYIRKKMKITANESIMDSAIHQHNLEKDAVHVLDNHWIKSLLNQQFDMDRNIFVSDLKSFHKREWKEIVRILKKSFPDIGLIHDDFSRQSNTITTEIKYQLAYDFTFNSINIKTNTDIEMILKEKYFANLRYSCFFQ